MVFFWDETAKGGGGKTHTEEKKKPRPHRLVRQKDFIGRKKKKRGQKNFSRF